MDRFLILDNNTGAIISSDNCTVIDIQQSDVRDMAEYWSDPNVESDETAVWLIELFGRNLSTILANADLSV